MPLVVSLHELGHAGHLERHRRARNQPRPAGQQRFACSCDDAVHIPWEYT